MISLGLFLVGCLLFVIYIMVLIADMRLNEFNKINKTKSEKAKKEAEKRNKPKEFKWPNNVPHIF